jgi:hypothetical protein
VQGEVSVREGQQCRAFASGCQPKRVVKSVRQMLIEVLKQAGRPFAFARPCA